MVTADKPLGQKAYGSIPHLPGSRMGPGDHHIGEGQARIATEKTRDKHDTVYVQEKLDGSCVSIARIDGEIVALGRAGYLASSSKYEMHQLFAEWVRRRTGVFQALLEDGERIVGEWLAQAHGTRYDLRGREPFVAFDIMRGIERLPVMDVGSRVYGVLEMPALLFIGATSIDEAMHGLGEYGHYGALDPVEGCVWRVERQGKVDFLAKYVRPEKIDGSYLESATGNGPVWNWRP